MSFKERPILFSAPMVRAILSSQKTQTRRVVKPPKWSNESEIYEFGGMPWVPDDDNTSYLIKCPYGQTGNRLWVRETWAQYHPAGVQDGRFSIKGRAGIPGPPPVNYRVIYRADGDPLRVWHCDGYPYRTASGPRDELDGSHPDVCSEFPGWTPSIHMPRWASRIDLEITDIRAERLQDISEADARAEGITDGGCLRCGNNEPCGCELPHPDARDSFVHLWNSINGDTYPWASNPWVWVVDFKHIEKTPTSPTDSDQTE